MERNYKVVLQDKKCDSAYLCGFYAKEEEALEAEKRFKALNPNGYYRTRPVNIDFINKAVDTDYSQYIASLIEEEEMNRVMKSDTVAEISVDCLTCGNRTYYDLSRTVPKDWTVVDIGCGYNAQSYLFKNHARYISVNPRHKYGALDIHCERFQAPGTEYYEMTGTEFVKKVLPKLNLDLDCTFAIMNYVPSEQTSDTIRRSFHNLYCFYPSVIVKQ